jgi:PucR C-terminal helix-turn-helix domain
VDKAMKGQEVSVQDARGKIFARLQSRRSEIEEIVFARVSRMIESTPLDPEYVEGLRVAVSAALDFGLTAIKQGEEWSPPVPAALLVQARLAARNSVALSTVLHRYITGYTALNDFLIQESEEGDFNVEPTLRQLLRAQAAILDRLIDAITGEYSREAERRDSSTAGRRAERIRRLVAGELLETSGFAYDFDGFHVGMVAMGLGAAGMIREIAATLNYRYLLTCRGEGTVWAWLGSRGELDASVVKSLAAKELPPKISMSVGEISQGLRGWRHTHRQALAATPIALRRPGSATRYADVILLASILQDDLSATSLKEIYLTPLSNDRDGGAALRQTLGAYFDAERNISSTAAALGVSRGAVIKRLRRVEERLGQQLNTCAAELEAALAIENFSGSKLLANTG